MARITNDLPLRRMVHTRRIVCTSYERSDGMYEIEGCMQDTKAHDSRLLFKDVPAGGSIHAMKIVVTVDSNLVIQHVEARTEAGPSPYCREINAAYGKLAGVTIGPGFNKEVKRRVGGANGCTHLSELLGPIATTAIQTMMGLHKTAAPRPASTASDRHPMTDSCHAWRQDGEVIQVLRSRRQAAAEEASAQAVTQPGPPR